MKETCFIYPGTLLLETFGKQNKNKKRKQKQNKQNAETKINYNLL